VITRNSYQAKNTVISLKVAQPNNDGAVGMTPTYTLSSPFGIFDETNWYRFYVYRSGGSGPYRLFVQWKKNGAENGLDVTGSLVINGAVYLRLRCDNTHVHFEASLDGTNWTGTYSEAFGLPGYTLDSSFYYELAAYNTPTNGVLKVDDFSILSTSSTPDTQPPVISSVAASDLTSSAATITWATNEAADSQVEYGLTTSYGVSSTLNAARVTSHTVTLANLTANTTYHYRVKSRDAAGNLATSGDFTLITLATGAIVLADNFNSGALNLTIWNKGTNAGNQSAVVSNQLQLQSQGTESGWVITKNAYAARQTIVQVKVVQPNRDGALGMAPTYALSSPYGIFNQNNWYRFYTYGAAPYRLLVQWKKNGVENDVDVTGNLVITGAIYLRLRFDATNIYFEASLDGAAWTNTYSEAFGLPGYALDSAFYYELAGYNTEANGVLAVDDFSITTFSGNPDTQPPLINQVAANNITNSGAQIVWATNETADSQVEYGLTASYGSATQVDPALFTSHAVILSNLETNTTYHYRVKSRDAAGNYALSTDFTFTTTTLATGSVAFANVQEIFNNNCARCHQGATAPGGMVLLAGQAYGNIVNVTSTEYPQWKRVQPGDRASSWLYTKITTVTPPVGSKMASLSADEIELIGKWIDQGATETPVPPYVSLEFRTTALGNAEISIAYFSGIVVWGGLPPYQFSVINGALPSGLMLDSNSGLLAGTPDAVGSYDFTIRVSDSQTPAATHEQAYHIDVFNTRDHWQLPPGFMIENVVSDLHLPVNIAFVPNPGPNPADPYFYVTLLYGDIIMVQRDFQKHTYATGLLNFVPTGLFPGSGEMGVTGIAVDPVSGDVFASMVYEELPGSEDFRNKVVRFHSTDGGRTAATQTTILSGFPAGISHQIQELTIGSDGKLYVNIGDGWVSEAAPNLNDQRGKVLRLNHDGSVPDDNPFPGNSIYATGFRNPFGAAWRQADGRLYISDNGPEFDDRVAKVLPSADYGWGLLSQDLTKGAIFLWNPTVAPVAMDFLHNSAFPANYYGNLFVGLSGPPYWFGPTARGKKIQRFGLDANGLVVSDSLFLDYVGAGAATVIGVAFGPDGLYFTDLYGENGFDQFGQTHGNIYRIRSTVAADTTRPAISNVQATIVTGTTATIVWQTDEAATRQVEYGLTTSYGLATPLQSDLATNHSMILSQLTPETTYQFRVLSADAANNIAVSSDFTFATTALDVTPPVISPVQVDSFTITSAVVKWTTNEPATSLVDFGTTTDYGSTLSNPQLVTTHRLQLSGLADSTLYHFRVRSLDGDGNAAESGDGTFTTRHNHNTQIDTTLETENLPIKTNGDARPPGWVLFENGYLAGYVTFPVTGSYHFTLRATGQEVLGEWSRAELRIDQAAKATIEINSSDYADFAVDFTVAAGPHEVAVAFINDFYDPPYDRNLYVDWLRIQNSAAAGSVVKSRFTASAPAVLPENFALQNFPNPFSASGIFGNTGTHIRFTLPQTAEIEVKIFDLAGRELRELASGARSAGSHDVIWNGRGRNGEALSSGVYLVRLRHRPDKNGAWSQLQQRVMMVK
jgi:glucose/arabinose dehydrogenase